MKNNLEEILNTFIELAQDEIFRAEIRSSFYANIGINYKDLINKYEPLIKDAEKLLKKIRKNKTNKDE